MGNEFTVALVALVVGLVALLIAGGQLLQQIFGTADGYRRCQRPIIGPWSRKTHLRWRWREFRFETMFTTPEILLFDRRSHVNVFDLNGNDLPIELHETICEKSDFGTEMVSWILLLKKLAELQGGWYQAYDEHKIQPSDPEKVVGYATKIGVIYRERSWDLVPAETVKPMASSRLGTMIVWALRLGLRWENLDFAGGVLRAEGNGHSLISTTMRVYGLVFQYNYNTDFDLLPVFGKRGLIQRRSTDMMCCGILPGNQDLDIPLIRLKGKTPVEDCSLLTSALNWLGIPRSLVAKIVAGHDEHDSLGRPVHDMIALLVPFQPLKGSSNTQIAYPIQTNVAPSTFSSTASRNLLLRDCPYQEVSAEFHYLSDTYNADFLCDQDKALVGESSASHEDKIQFLENLREIYDWTLRCIQATSINYKELVAAHIKLVMSVADASSSAYNDQDYPIHTTVLCVGNLPCLCTMFENIDKQVVEESWWMLVLRGIVWRMSVHFSHQDSVVPSRLYYGQTPVYIM